MILSRCTGAMPARSVRCMSDAAPGPGADDLLPERTSDEREEAWERGAADDERFLREVPPHHGD